MKKIIISENIINKVIIPENNQYFFRYYFDNNHPQYPKYDIEYCQKIDFSYEELFLLWEYASNGFLYYNKKSEPTYSSKITKTEYINNIQKKNINVKFLNNEKLKQIYFSFLEKQVKYVEYEVLKNFIFKELKSQIKPEIIGSAYFFKIKGSELLEKPKTDTVGLYALSKNIAFKINPDDYYLITDNLIQSVNVDPEYRNKGIAKKLYLKMEEISKYKIVPAKLLSGAARGLHKSLGNINEQNQKITFYDTTVGAHHGQYDMVLYVMVDGEKVGSIAYSVFQGTPYINHIEVDPKYRRQGFAVHLINHLSKEYGYENIDWGMLTTDGAALKKVTDKIHNYDPNKTNHLDKNETIKKIEKKSKEAAKFLKNLVDWGKERVHDVEYDWDAFGDIDQTDLMDVAEWVEGSKVNWHEPKEKPDGWVMNFLNNL